MRSMTFGRWEVRSMTFGGGGGDLGGGGGDLGGGW